MTRTYPDDSVQNLCAGWWEETDESKLEYGRLVKAFLPHVDQQPYVLVAQGRTDPEAHREADFEVRPLLRNLPPSGAYLPVAGLPAYEGEVRIVQRAKKRPALVLSSLGTEVASGLRTGSARYQTNRSVLVAPYYGADQSGRRGGFRSEFLKRIRRAVYPQYMWDSLPIGGPAESVLRLDHVQPLGENAQAVEVTPYRLASEAAEVVEEWLTWFRTGELSQNGILALFRSEMSRG